MFPYVGVMVCEISILRLLVFPANISVALCIIVLLLSFYFWFVKVPANRAFHRTNLTLGTLLTHSQPFI